MLLGKLPGGRADGPDQRLRADDELGRPGHQRKQQDPGPELIGQVPELAELTLAEWPPGREREHRGAPELGPHVGRPSAERTERAVLGRAERGDRAGQPERVARGVDGGPFGDLDHGQRRPLRVAQHQPAGLGRDRGGGNGERDRDRPRRAVGQLAPGGDGGQVLGRQVAAQRGERARGEQLELAELLVARGPGRPVGKLGWELRQLGHVRLRIAAVDDAPPAQTTRAKRSVGLRIT